MYLIRIRMNRSSLCTLSGILASIAVMLTAASAVIGTPEVAAGSESASPRILHIMSYHHVWEWNEDQLNGFKHGLNLPAAQSTYFKWIPSETTVKHGFKAWEKRPCN
ncbi:hypothetical protein [Desulfosarcina ovata]|uniref:hypothetical protein n=1 Tax=Desulfosarcina ovata TaxID=83564 RepID=UPI0012D2BFCD|nr:hypothetical protein [Desulfosarcina ovata]